MLEITGLSVMSGQRLVLDGLNLKVASGKTVVLFGPNGSGKTTLLKAIMGMPSSRVTAGRIVFKGRDITALGIDLRARMGIGMLFQHPPAFKGVTLGALVGRISAASGMDASAKAGRLGLDPFMQRELNRGFSGGELKRTELLQLAAQGADFLMFDEPDSGVDLVSVGIVGEVMNGLLQKDTPAAARTRSALVITHGGHILDYINADEAYVLYKGRLSCGGNPRDMMDDIRARGYEGCARCLG